MRLHPPIGTATERDATESKHLHGTLCELVDGTLVEKAMGYYESSLAMILGGFWHMYLRQNPIGFVVGESGSVRTGPGRIRMPDAGFYLWAGVPGGDDVAFAQGLLAQYNLAVLPGSLLAREAHGINPGAGRIRLALVAEQAECLEAAHRIVQFVQSLPTST